MKKVSSKKLIIKKEKPKLVSKEYFVYENNNYNLNGEKRKFDKEYQRLELVNLTPIKKKRKYIIKKNVSKRKFEIYDVTDRKAKPKLVKTERINSKTKNVNDVKLDNVKINESYVFNDKTKTLYVQSDSKPRSRDYQIIAEVEVSYVKGRTKLYGVFGGASKISAGRSTSVLLAECVDYAKFLFIQKYQDKLHNVRSGDIVGNVLSYKYSYYKHSKKR